MRLVCEYIPIFFKDVCFVDVFQVMIEYVLLAIVEVRHMSIFDKWYPLLKYLCTPQ